MIRNFFIQVLIAFLIFQTVSFLRETSMLETDINITKSNELLFNNVPTLMGDFVSLESTDKNTIIYFFAPWCQICDVSISNLQNIYENNDQLDVIAVALDYHDENEVRNFTKRHQLTFPIALGNERIKQAFMISAYPSYYVISDKNEIVGKSLGYSSELGLYLRTL